MESHKKDISPNSLLAGFKTAYRAALKEVENPGGVLPKPSPAKGKVVDSVGGDTSATALPAALSKWMLSTTEASAVASAKLAEDFAAALDQKNGDEFVLGVPMLQLKLRDCSDKIRGSVTWKRIHRDVARG